MARARNIKPAFFSNDELADIEPIGRLLFIGLWTICDYKGNLEYRPKKIKASILPYDDCKTEQLMINLEQSGFVQSYSNSDVTYINISNFTKHQNPHKNERDKGSDVPCIDDKLSQPYDLKGSRIKSDNISINPDNDGTNPADSLILIPDPLILIPDNKHFDQSKIDRVDSIKEAFSYFWSNMHLPKKAKPIGEKSFTKAVIKIDDPMHFAKFLVADTETRFNNQQIGFDKMHPSTYLNQARWEDDHTIDADTKKQVVSIDGGGDWAKYGNDTF